MLIVDLYYNNPLTTYSKHTTPKLTRFEDVEDQEGGQSFASNEQNEPSMQSKVVETAGAVPTFPSMADTEAATA